jgi:hypothetical protein
VYEYMACVIHPFMYVSRTPPLPNKTCFLNHRKGIFYDKIKNHLGEAKKNYGGPSAVHTIVVVQIL